MKKLKTEFINAILSKNDDRIEQARISLEVAGVSEEEIEALRRKAVDKYFSTMH